ncbi:hypothetical protein [Pseudaestuariivita sp.]|uniref:hypothetical protein n=1 Tax=Pseudaestuariivita sp. TaxID=2211669 RepID=UPI0040596C71
MTANPLFRKAVIRSVLATVAIAAWVLFFDGPAFAWALLAFYLLLTWVTAFGLTRWVAKRAERDDDQ